jgi:maltose O-acetyltransferase
LYGNKDKGKIRKYWVNEEDYMRKTEKEKMLSGELYLANDTELKKLSYQARALLDELNATSHTDNEARSKIIHRLFSKVGKNVNVNKPFYCDYGVHISVGDYFYANYDCIILDVNKVTIGDNVFFAPRVCIYTAGHPIDCDVRRTQLEYGKPVVVGNDVWVGGNVIINPGVTIGNDVVIGSGSVVTKDIPDHVVAVGNPCRVLRTITNEDRSYWEKQKRIYETT